jgi:hypothetical protein
LESADRNKNRELPINVQVMVDNEHQIIIFAEVFGRGQASSLLKPMPEETVENDKGIGKADNYKVVIIFYLYYYILPCKRNTAFYFYRKVLLKLARLLAEKTIEIK